MKCIREDIISILDGSFDWNGINTKLLLPMTKLDISCILEKEYLEVKKVVDDLILRSVVFEVEGRIYLKLS